MSDVVVVGGSFAGLAAALDLRRLLPSDSNVTVVSANDNFVFMPSLIWVMQGWRELEDITFPIKPILDEAGIDFQHARLEALNPDEKMLSLSSGEKLSYDKLLIATGGEWDWDQIPGSRPRPDGYVTSILTPGDALAAREHWQAFLSNPGPVVIGIAMGGTLFGAAYEMALNLHVALEQAGVRDQASITLVTPEPYLGHFGLEGIGNSQKVLTAAFDHRDILYSTEKQVREVEADRLVVSPLQHFPSHLTMLIPPYRGIKPVRDAADLADEQGLIPVDEHQRSVRFDDIYAAGTAANMGGESSGTLPIGKFTPGTVSAELGRIAAQNIAADLGHGEHRARTEKALKGFYVLDSGADGLLMSLGTQSWLNFQTRVPGPWAHWAKSVAERYQMWQVQTGNY